MQYSRGRARGKRYTREPTCVCVGREDVEERSDEWKFSASGSLPLPDAVSSSRRADGIFSTLSPTVIKKKKKKIVPKSPARNLLGNEVIYGNNGPLSARKNESPGHPIAGDGNRYTG